MKIPIVTAIERGLNLCLDFGRLMGVAVRQAGQANVICQGLLAMITNKTLGDGRRSFTRTFHLPFLDHVHYFDATQNDARAVEILEAQHQSDDAFDGPMVLFDMLFRYLT